MGTPVLLLLAILLLSRCAATPQPAADTPTAPTPYTLATPVSDTPAAGICGEATGDTVTVTLVQDVPSPRCLKVKGSQHLEIQNGTQLTLSFVLGPYSDSIAPGDHSALDAALGDFLAPGVHRILIGAGAASGPEIWLAP